MAYEKVITVRNQGSVRVRVEPDSILLDLVAGPGSAHVTMQPESARLLKESLETALLYYDRAHEGGTGG